jgi:UDP-glucuronate decarboxylase
VVSNFAVQALAGEPISIYGDGSQTRSFCYVTDLIDGLVRLMDSPADFTGPVNLGNPEEIEIGALAKRIIDLTGSASPLTFERLPEDDPLRRQPDIGLAKARLGWSPTVDLDSGLRRTIDYFRSIQGACAGTPIGGNDARNGSRRPAAAAKPGGELIRPCGPPRLGLPVEAR